MPKALLTGSSGFVGPYLARHLKTRGYEVWGGSLSKRASDDYQAVFLDVTQAAQVEQVIGETAPDEIYHLAGITRPALDSVRAFYDVNLYGTLNVLGAAQKVQASVLVVSSAYVYGRHDEVLTEETQLRPVNPYGSSKAAGDLAAIGYALDGLQVVRVRPFNHSGPGQSPDFLLPTLVSQLARIEAGQAPPVLKLGNLNTVRDFSDVRDVVRAYPLLLEHGQNGEVYNLASGVGTSVRELAEQVMSLSKVPVQLETEPSRVRSTDIPFLVGDASKTRDATGWTLDYTLEKTLQDMLEFEREKLAHA